MNLLRVRRLFAGETVARFGTTGPGGHPHLMPVPFAVIEDGADGVVVCVVERQPRSIAGTARLHDVAACPRVSFLTDHSADADERWWVHADAVAEVLRPSNRPSTGPHTGPSPRQSTPDPRFALATDALASRYRSLDETQIGAIVWGTVTSWTGWTAALDQAA